MGRVTAIRPIRLIRPIVFGEASMCLLAILHRVASDSAVVVGANREEYYLRGGEPPRRLDGVAAVGGVDPAHGGTWLGVNAQGLLVAVTNRRKTRLPVSPRSRGLLARDLLALHSAPAAVQEALRQLGTDSYAGCNFLLADAGETVVIHAGDWLRARPLPPGIHVLSNRDVNDPMDERVVYALEWLGRQPSISISSAVHAVETLGCLCATTQPAIRPLCFHADDRGTVSSSVIALRSPFRESLYLHAQGSPDRTPYRDLSENLRRLDMDEHEKVSFLRPNSGSREGKV
jgi:hypothetical protein